MATHSGVLAWRIPGMGEPVGLLSMGAAQSRTRLKCLSSSGSSRGKSTDTKLSRRKPCYCYLSVKATDNYKERHIKI